MLISLFVLSAIVLLVNIRLYKRPAELKRKKEMECFIIVPVDDITYRYTYMFYFMQTI